MKAELLRGIVEAQRAGRDVVLATRLGDGAQVLLVPGDFAPGDFAPGRDSLEQGLRVPELPRRPGALPGLDDHAIAAVVRGAAPRTIDTAEGPVFLRPYLQPAHLIVIGAVHIAQALAPMAKIAGFRVTVLDPREGFATAKRFPGAALVCEWPDRAMDSLVPGRRTAVVALTHDPRIDDPALVAALRSEAFYIGALGSRKTQAARRERLGAAGFATSDLERIHGPVGLPIGARTPEEIAVAVLAQVIGALRG